MEPHGADLTGIAITLAAAVLAGLGLRKIGQPPLVGYILAGVLLGPSAAGLVARSESIGSLAEIGVVLLLFLIGMELSLKAFVRVLRPATTVAFGQIAASLLIAYLFGWVLDWPAEQSLVIGFVIALSSTAVAISILDQIGELRGPIGQITIGVMIAQDIAVIPILIFVESLGGGGADPIDVSIKVVFAIAFLLALVYWLSRRGKLRLPFSEAFDSKVELATLSALAICFAAAALSGVLGLSPAYGAFCAGLLVGGSTLRARMIEVTEPVQSVLLVVFFLSVGLLIDVGFLWDNAALVLLFTLAVLVLKTVLNVALIRIAGESWDSAMKSGLIMAPIGEFSFVLAGAGVAAGALDWSGHRLAIAVIAATLLLAPVWADAVRRVQALARLGVSNFRDAMAELYSEEIAALERGATPIRRGWRRVGRTARALRNAVATRALPVPAADPSANYPPPPNAAEAGPENPEKRSESG